VRNASQAMPDVGDDDSVQAAVNEAGEAVSQIISDCNPKQSLIISYFEYLSEMKSEENAQNKYEEFARDHNEVHALLLIGRQYPVLEISESLLEDELISQTEQNTLVKIWNSISWATDAAQALYHETEYNAQYWTDKSLEFKTRYNEEAIAEHELKNGINNVHRLEVPIDTFLRDAVQRVEELYDWLEEVEDAEYAPRLRENSINNLEGIRQRISDIENKSGKLNDVVEPLEGES
jgi:hypothetical protein